MSQNISVVLNDLTASELKTLVLVVLLTLLINIMMEWHREYKIKLFHQSLVRTLTKNAIEHEILHHLNEEQLHSLVLAHHDARDWSHIPRDQDHNHWFLYTTYQRNVPKHVVTTKGADTCAICWEDNIQTHVLYPCGHTMCGACWIKCKHTCPYCRKRINGVCPLYNQHIPNESINI